MTNNIPNAKYALLAEFISGLEAEGYSFGIDRHLKLQQLLSKIPDDTPLADLKTLLCPAIVTSDQEQEVAYRIFDRSLVRIRHMHTGDTGPTKAKENRRWIFGLSVLGILTLLSLFVFLKSNTEPIIPVDYAFTIFPDSTSQVCIDSTTLIQLGGAVDGAYFANSKAYTQRTKFGVYEYDGAGCISFTAGDSIGTDSVRLFLFGSAENDSLIVHLKPTIETPVSSIAENQDEQIVQSREKSYLFDFLKYDHPFDLRRLAVTSSEEGWESILKKYSSLFRALTILLFTILLAAFLFWRERKRRKIVAEIDDNNNPPHVWGMKAEATHEPLVGTNFENLVRKLRQRATTEERYLNLSETIDATIQKGGMVDFRYNRKTRPPEYVFLVERNVAGNHISALYDFLYQKIKANEVLVERYFYQSDPRVCWNEEGNISLRDIQKTSSNARLIIIGNGYQLLSPLNGRVAKWTQLLNFWKDRVLLSTVPTRDWGRRESQLKEVIGLVPASLDGLEFAINQMELGLDADFEKWTDTLEDSMTSTVQIEEDIVNELQLYYPKYLVKWIAGCAVYPSLEWPLTTAIGEMLNTSQQAILSVQHLAQLCRLDWFQKGVIPIEVRSELLKWLSDTDQVFYEKVRAEINTILDANPPPLDSVAYEEYALNRALNEWVITTDSQRKKELEDEIAKRLDAGVEADMVVIKEMSEPKTAFDFIVPKSWHSRVYKGGLTALGIKGLGKDLFWALPLWLVLSSLLAFWPLQDQSCKSIFKVYTYEKVKHLPGDIVVAGAQNIIYSGVASLPDTWKRRDTMVIGTGEYLNLDNDFIDRHTIQTPDGASVDILAENDVEYNQDSITICLDNQENIFTLNHYLCRGAIIAGDYDYADSLIEATTDFYLQAANSTTTDSLYQLFIQNTAIDYWNQAIPTYRKIVDNQLTVEEEEKDTICFFFEKASLLDTANTQYQKGLRWCNQEVVANFNIIANEYCAPCEVEFENLSFDADRVEWDFGDGNTSTAISPTHRYEQAGVYEVKLTTYGNNGGQDIAGEVFKVFAPVENFGINVLSDEPYRTGSAIQFSTNVKEGNVNWNFGDGNVQANAFSGSNIYKEPGTYEVQATISNPCKDTIAKFYIEVEGQSSPVTVTPKDTQPEEIIPDPIPEYQEVPTPRYTDNEKLQLGGGSGAKRFRCMWRDDPSTSMVIGWDQTSGGSPTLYYDEVNFGKQIEAYRNKQLASQTTASKGMNNHFARLKGLKPNTVYYFVIQSSTGISLPMSFMTAPDSPNQRLSVIAGSSSRNNRAARRNANKTVSKLRPHMVVFDGDMTDSDTPTEWSQWLDDWQLTIGSDGRLFPIVPARGNHEASNASIAELFDISNANLYYALSFGGNLFRLYTLNTSIPPGGDQREWLERDLRANSNVKWKMAQYHRSMRPHTSRKPEGDNMLFNWALLFYNYQVNLVLESDAHVVKSTYPVRPSNEDGSDEDFIRDELKGTVYIGEGGWGAPLRPADDLKSWTRSSGSFNQFKWIFISRNAMEVRTVRTDNPDRVGEVSDENRFSPPLGLALWNPPSGSVITIKNNKVSDVFDSNVFINPENEISITPDSRGYIEIAYKVEAVSDINVRIIKSSTGVIVSSTTFQASRVGKIVKKLDVSTLPSGDYFLHIKKSDGETLKSYLFTK